MRDNNNEELTSVTEAADFRGDVKFTQQSQQYSLVGDRSFGNFLVHVTWLVLEEWKYKIRTTLGEIQKNRK